MKTKRRHELETNELADWLGQTYRSILPYANHLLWGAVILAVLVLGASWLIRSWRQPARLAASRLSAALAPRGFGMDQPQQLDARRQDFQAVADEFPDSVPGQWARLLAADTLRQQGMRSYTTDRDGALASLRNAEREYRELTERTTGMRWLDERALLGRAKALEALGELNDARDVYQQLLERYPAEEITVDAQLGQPEQLDRYLFRRLKEDRPDDLIGAIAAGLVEIQQQGQWQPADRRTIVEAGTKLRVQFDGLYTLEAKERLNALNKDEVVRFYEWIETAEPPPLPELPTTPSTGPLTEPGADEQGIIPEFEPEPGQSDQLERENDPAQSESDPPQERPAPDTPPSAPSPSDSPEQPNPDTPQADDANPDPDAGAPETPQGR